MMKKKVFCIFSLLLPLFLSVRCSLLTKRVSLNINDQSVISHPIDGINLVRLKTTPAETEKKGRAIVQNRYQFHQDLFQQSQDPYFGTYRWSMDCIRKNQSEIPTELNFPAENQNAFRFKTRATADKELNTDICQAGSEAAYRIVQYCPEKKMVIDLVATGSNADFIELICPNNLEIKK